MGALCRLPGIGRKTAERLALHLARARPEEARALAAAVARVGAEVNTCARCRNLADRDPCAICADPARDSGLLCVVESPADLAAMEAAGAYRGLYFVLSGALSPLDGVGPGQLGLDALTRRAAEGVRELIIATNSTVEGEATADLVAQSLARPGLLISRLGYGMPVGGDLKYIDGLTIARALESRRRREPGGS
ncbi:recombination protein RecR [Desulfarculus baarsii DSM 2075]|uniref:Recombination protein RecR n=2 Tax=Desulfarculus baarsii TaxID=453230 RepID=E1QJN2_DESB2|nr:recombination protein RecR [Desulfarculus baarsii DSM 2075]